MDADAAARLEVTTAQREMAALNFGQAKREFQETVDTAPDDREQLEVAIGILEEEMNEYAETDRYYQRLYLEVNGSNDDFQIECLLTKRNLREAKALIGKWKKKVSSEGDDARSSVSSHAHLNPDVPNRRRLPKLNLPTFSGENRDWIPFWSQFEEIHLDANIPTVDKFQYLLQAMKEGTLAHKIIKEYTLSTKNYQPALDSLKERFGRESFLVKVYVRDLLELVIDNSKKETVDLSELYVQLSAQLRVLTSLGVTTDKCAFILYPVFECCVPREVLKAFYRDHSTKDNDDCEKQLQQLMDFLKKEVNSEDNIRLACGGLTAGKDSKLERRELGGKKLAIPKQNGGFSTASGLLSTMDSSKRDCVFCGANHFSSTCSEACKLTVEEKKNLLKEKNYCFKCIRERNQGHQCKTNPQCLNCGGKHETVMCFKLFGNRDQSADKDAVEIKQDNSASNITSDGKAVFLKTLVVTVKTSEGDCKLRAVIDEGSHKSYILKSRVQNMNILPVFSEPVIHSLFGGQKTAVINHKVYDLEVSDVDGNNTCQVRLSDSDTISGKINCYPHGPWLTEVQKENIVLSDLQTSNSPVDILFGADIASKLLTGKMIKLECGAMAVETLLGWTLLGEAYIPEPEIENEDPTKSRQELLLNSLHVADEKIEKLWRLDTLGITDPVEKRGKLEVELETLKFFQDTVRINAESRVEGSLPWVDGHSRLPSYYWSAKKKLQLTSSKLIADKKLKEYDDLFKLWQEKGMIEEVPNADCEVGHYLQHRAVYNPNSSTTPTRPVFNASYKAKGHPSLNECLRKGPNLLELIPSLITRFRLNRIGVLADISKAFQQISVDPQDRDCSRFLWWKDLTMKEVIVYRHKRVVFGVNASPFLLAATLQFIFKNVPEHLKLIAELLDKSFYVDNLILSTSTMEEAENVKNAATHILSTYKMELRGWEMGPVDIEEKQPTSLLGLKWNMNQDTIVLEVPDMSTEVQGTITRRKILSLCNSIFDPLGFVSPFILNFKLLLQASWSTEGKKKGWDDAVSDEIKEKFESLVKQTVDLKSIGISRWMNSLHADRSGWTLHIFVDGSKLAYAACVFLRVEKEGEVDINLIQASSRVTPLKPMTIPRTELISCLIGARLGSYVKKCLEYDEIQSFYYTDSSTALYWITTDGDWGVFVQNRQKEILQHSSRQEWSHIPGECNPADLPSRGCSGRKLVESSWWKGPSWLYKKRSEWPQSSVNVNMDEVSVEMRKTVSTAVNVESPESHLYYKLCQLDDFNQMMNAVGDDTRDAEQRLLKLSQKIHFNGKGDLKLKKLEIIGEDEDLLKVKTRLFYADFNDEFRCPTVLPSKCPIVKALIMKIHVDNCHGKLHFLLAKLREKYWILRSRQTIRDALRKCSTCRRFDSKALQVNSPPLPIERLEAKNPFEVTGIDLCGPMFLKNQQKVWIALFTCAVYRAVHLELVTAIDTKQFKMALRRFVSRRGKPKLVFTDNGTNFVGCNNELKAIDWSKVKESPPGQDLEWRFIPPASPWWGGWWERMVGLVKDLLRRVLGQATLNQIELITVLADVEATVNDRPITYVSEDPADLIPITPALFLTGNRSSKIPELDEVDGRSLNKRIKYMQQVREEMRNRFRTEYLGQLGNLKQVKDSPGLVVGDTVLVQCDNKKRMNWPLGKVIEMVPGRDGKVRVVVVKTQDGEMKRPVQRIYPLEVPYEASTGNSNQIEIPKELTMLDLCSGPAA